MDKETVNRLWDKARREFGLEYWREVPCTEQCRHCGYPLYRGMDSGYVGSAEVFCSRRCAVESLQRLQ